MGVRGHAWACRGSMHGRARARGAAASWEQLRAWISVRGALGGDGAGRAGERRRASAHPGRAEPRGARSLPLRGAGVQPCRQAAPEEAPTAGRGRAEPRRRGTPCAALDAERVCGVLGAGRAGLAEPRRACMHSHARAPGSSRAASTVPSRGGVLFSPPPSPERFCWGPPHQPVDTGRGGADGPAPAPASAPPPPSPPPPAAHAAAAPGPPLAAGAEGPGAPPAGAGSRR
jgi:hypothetical protein